MGAPLPSANQTKAGIAILENIFSADTRIQHDIAASLSSSAYLAAALHNKHHQPTILITDGPTTMEKAYNDLRTLSTLFDHVETLLFPPAEPSSAKSKEEDPDLFGQRLACIIRLCAEHDTRDRFILVTCIQALLQKIPVVRKDSDMAIKLIPGSEIDVSTFEKRLYDIGYEIQPEVYEKGKVSVRGGIIDIWPPLDDYPSRLELLGQTIETIRSFDPETQLSKNRSASILIVPAKENIFSKGKETCASSIISMIDRQKVVIVHDVEGIAEHAGLYEKTGGNMDAHIPYDRLLEDIDKDKDCSILYLHNDPAYTEATISIGMTGIDGFGDISRDILQPDILERKRISILQKSSELASSGGASLIFFDSQASLRHFSTSYKKQLKGTTVQVGMLSSGFDCSKMNMRILAEPDLYGRRHRLSGQQGRAIRRSAMVSGLRVTDLTDIEPGDLVVHVEHGIGKYMGMREIIFAGRTQEVLTIEYDERSKLHVPVSQAHLLSRYVGVSKHSARLHKLGSARWDNEKKSAEKAIVDLAGTLLETQAHRNTMQGLQLPPDTPWQHEFEASFPYEETPDQEKVIAEIKKDMEATRPMDRLVCGDAGYGKTEMAMRAAFKTVMSGMQVAVLVPTTILAQQHLETFRERMAPYPVSIDMISRFVNKQRQIETKNKINDGSLDIVIGTHSLLQPDVRFSRLGLVIIDEEQRFGVRHKEWFKSIKKMIEVLTLTATPIPRTLYMSMTGARDMSLLQTPPNERVAIETIIARDSDDAVRNAIAKELNREGQVFFLHNRINSIHVVERRLKRIIPEARIAIAHGRMAAGELADVMRNFAAGMSDILLCTTIIESGMDFPRANTILIDRADRFGLADLYQLRGRVGRSDKKAFAYLLLPIGAYIDPDARERIDAMKRFSGLSSGFNLALRDLEIRGAGNILGSEQSGHITAIGFGLYCQMLKRTISKLKNEPVPLIIDTTMNLDFISLGPSATDHPCLACIPYSYIEDEKSRISLYRKIAECSSIKELGKVKIEMKDRFGPLPVTAERLLLVAEIRILCAFSGISSIETNDDKILARRAGEPILKDNLLPRMKATDPDRKLKEISKFLSRISK